MSLTVTDLYKLSNNVRACADSIDNYRNSKYTMLTNHERADLLQMKNDLYDQSDNIAIIETQNIIGNIATNILTVQNSINDITTAISKINDLKKILAVGGAVVDLSYNIAILNGDGIVGALTNIQNALNA